MFSLTRDLQFHLYSNATDMRKSFNGLCGIIQGDLKKKPTSGDVYIFVNRSKNKIKLLRWEYGGFVLYYKRLEQGTLTLPDMNGQKSCSIRWTDLVLLIEGITIEKSRINKRFSLPKYL